MDKGCVLRVIQVGARVRVGTAETIHEYKGMTEPNHKCQAPKPLTPNDCVTVKNLTAASVLVTGPCGCDFLLWDRTVEEGTRTTDDVGVTTWDSLLDRVRMWTMVRFALNTDIDLWVWVFIIAAAAHLEQLAVAVLWTAEPKPTPFQEYQPKMTLGQVVGSIRKKSLLDDATVEKLDRIAKLRNSVAHRGTTYGLPFREGYLSRGQYNGRHVFTDPAGLRQLMDDVDAATNVMGQWLQNSGLVTDEKRHA